MPSVELDLGRFVVVRRRKNGTDRVLFELPKRLRPPGWSATIPLPLEGRNGDLKDAEEVKRIQQDAAKLYARYLDARYGRKGKAEVKRSFDTLIATWEVTQAYKALKPKTRKGYDLCVREVRAWAEISDQIDPTLLTQAKAQEFLGFFDDRPTTRRHVKNVLKLIMDQAKALNWRPDNPVEDIKVKVPTSKVRIWEQADVDAHAWAAAVAGQFGLAAMIHTEWEIGQRITDACLFRHGAEWSDTEGVFRFWQSKTDAYVTIPVSDRTAALIRQVKRDGSLYLFTNAATGGPFKEASLAHTFADIRDQIRDPADKRAPLVMRALRHSCVVQLARADSTVAEIASITGHSITSVQQILSRYLPRDNQVAWNAQAKRGLIGGGPK